MKKIFKYLAIICVLLTGAIITTGSLTAQVFNHPRHELSVYAGSGLSTLQYDLSTGRHKNGFGGQFGAGYNCFFSPKWGLGTGVELAIYRAKANLDNFSDSYDVNNAVAANNYTFTYAINKYEETQQAMYLNLPLMFHFQTGRQYKFYAKLGGKVAFPINTSAKAGKYELSTKGYFPQEGRTYDDLPQYGFGTFEYLKRKMNVENFKLHYIASAEMGLKWKIRVKNSLYTGIFFDYGLNNIQTKNDKTFVMTMFSPQMQPTQDKPAMSPLIESSYSNGHFTGEIVPLAVGLKLRFTFLQ